MPPEQLPEENQAKCMREADDGEVEVNNLAGGTHKVTEEGKEGDDDEFKTLKYQLLGPSLTKAGQDSVDQAKVSEIIYNASKGSKFFLREQERDRALTRKIDRLLHRKHALDRLGSPALAREERAADRLAASLEATRDLSRRIVHVDCDAFYASVEELARPELRAVPFAVGAGVLTTCNYVARRFGCRSGMAAFVARRLCPELVLVRPSFERYAAKGREVRAVLARYDARLESASVDEACLDITAYCRGSGGDGDGGIEDVVARLRREVRAETGVTVSAGVAANARLAKICSDVDKPDGQHVLPSEREAILAFTRDLPARKVPGVGRALERELLAVLGARTLGDVHRQRRYLRPLFGERTATFLLACSLGLGRTCVGTAASDDDDDDNDDNDNGVSETERRRRRRQNRVRKSVGTEHTFKETADPAVLRAKLRATAEDLVRDLARAGCRGGRTLCLKVKLHTFEVLTRQTAVVPRGGSDAVDEVYDAALPMLARLEREMPGMRLRLMGLRCTHLVSAAKPDAEAFFGLGPPKSKRVGGDVDDGGGGVEVLDAVAGQEHGYDDNDGDDDDDDETYRRHGKEIAADLKHHHDATTAAEAAADNGGGGAEEWWDCPVCGRPQTADERLFNEHIDLCLSRQTIRDAVQADNGSGSGKAGNTRGSHGTSTTTMGLSCKRGQQGSEREAKTRTWTRKTTGKRTAAAGGSRAGRGDPRQKKLCFGPYAGGLREGEDA